MRAKSSIVLNGAYLWFGAPTEKQIRVFAWVLAVVVLATAAFQSVRLSPPTFPVDDAYITLHNAQALHWGHDPNFVGASPVAGSTSLTHLGLIAGLLFVVPPLWATQVAAWLGIILYLLGISRLTFRLGGSLAQAILVVFLAAFAGVSAYQLLNGLETGLVTAGVTWLLVFAIERRAIPLGIVAGLGAYTRPELAILSVLVGVTFIIQSIRLKDTGAIWLSLLAATATALPWAFWSYHETHQIFPGTAQAKIAFFAEANYSPDVRRQLLTMGVTGFLAPLSYLVVGFLLGIMSNPYLRAGALMFCIVLGLFYVNFPGGSGHYSYRYLYLAMPLLLAGVVSPSRFSPTARTASTILLAMAAFVSWQGTGINDDLVSRFKYSYLDTRGFTTNDLADVAKFCNQNLPKDAVLLIHDAGYIAYATKFHMVDVVGLKTPWAVEYNKKYTLPTAGDDRSKAVAAIAIRGHADYFVALKMWGGFLLAEHMRELGWKLDPVYTGSYMVYKLTPPKASQPRDRSQTTSKDASTSNPPASQTAKH